MEIIRTKISFMNVRYFVVALVFAFMTSAAYGQAREGNSRPTAEKTNQKNKGFQLDKVMVGGNFGAQFGTITIVHLNPTVGYKLKESWVAGFSATYLYAKDDRFRPSYVNNIYGGSIFTQYYFLQNFIAHTEYEVLNVGEQIDGRRLNVNGFLVGGGYRSQIGGNSFANIMVLYNLIDDLNYPYRNPIIRIGFGIGL